MDLPNYMPKYIWDDFMALTPGKAKIISAEGTEFVASYDI